jgi:hypothetical protein
MLNRRNEMRTTRLLALPALIFGLATTQLGVAQRPADQTIGATHGQIAGAIAGIAGAGAAVGIIAYVAIKHNHSVTGCAESGPNGMQLTSEPDRKPYVLVGNVAGIKTGERVRVSGRRSKAKSADPTEFLVEKVARDFGPCEGAGSSQ